MAGQIIKRGEQKYLVRVESRSNGERRQFSKTVHGSRKDADKVLREILRERDLGKMLEPSRETLNEFFERYFNDVVSKRVRRQTLDSYKENVKRYIESGIGKKPVVKLTRAEIQNLYNSLQNEKELSARSVRYLHSILKAALDEAIQQEIISFNPCRGIRLPVNRPAKVITFRPVEFHKLLQACDTPTKRALWTFAVMTGMRVEEILGLKWKAIDFEKRNVKVFRALVRFKGGDYIFDKPKTPTSLRTVPISEDLCQLLKSHKVEQNKHRLRLGSAWNDEDLVFPSQLGKPMTHTSLRRKLRELIDKAELPTHFTPKSCRHTCATWLLEQGENPKVVAERLGHSSIRMTLDVYSEVIQPMQSAATDKLNQLLKVAK